MIYVGAYLSEDVLTNLLPEIEKQRVIPRPWPFAPTGVQVVRRLENSRQPGAKELWFFINENEAPATIEKLPADGFDLVSNQPASGPFSLPPNGIAVIQAAREATPGV